MISVFRNKKLHDTVRLSAANELRIIYEDSNIDSALYIAQSMLEMTKNKSYDKWRAKAFYAIGYANFEKEKFRDAIQFYQQSADVLAKMNKHAGIAKCYSNIGLAYLRLGEYDKAFDTYKKAKSIFKQTGDTVMLARTINQLAMVRDYEGRWLESLDLYYQSLKIFEDINDAYGQSVILVNIAVIYEQLKDERKATEILNRSLKLKQQTGDEHGEAIILSMLAGYLSDKEEYQQALQYLNKSLKLFEKNEDFEKVSKAYCGIGKVYARQGNAVRAREYYEKGIELQRKFELNTELATSLSGLGNVYVQLKQYDEAAKLCHEGLEISKKTGNLNSRKENCMCLTNAYEKKGDAAKALIYFKEYTALKDSLINDENTREATRKEMRFGFAKKQLKDSLAYAQQQQIKDLQLSEQEAVIKSEKAQKMILYIGIILFLVIGVLSYRSYRIKKKDNEVIAAQKTEVEKQKGEIEQQKDLIEEQKHIVEEKQKEIIDSINYAKRIQYALLAHDALLDSQLNNYFVLFRPKDIVSGDFYWATEHQGKFYLAVCDSTGHGVPGAFMSLLNIGFLSEAIKEKNISQPHNILNYVRERLIESIGQGDQKDGMDAILVCLEKEGKNIARITYAAANNQPVLVHGNELRELEKDKMPVGKGERTESFRLFEIPVTKGDMLVLYTDGFADQFGGPKGKKFKYKPLNDLILQNATLAEQQQKQYLTETFENWKGNLEQVDDVTIVGIRI